MHKPIQPIGERLKSHRKTTGMSSKELAAKIGVSPVTLWSWERGRTRPSWKREQAIAAVLLPDQQDAPLEEQGRFAAKADLAAIMEEAKLRIAQAAGIDPDQVTIAITY